MINKEYNALVYDLIKKGESIKNISIILATNTAKISAIKHKIINENLGREEFINSYNTHLKRESYREYRELEITYKNVDPIYDIGDIIDKEFKIIHIYNDKINRYLTQNIEYKYKKMYFEDEISEILRKNKEEI